MRGHLAPVTLVYSSYLGSFSGDEALLFVRKYTYISVVNDILDILVSVDLLRTVCTPFRHPRSSFRVEGETVRVRDVPVEGVQLSG